MEDRLNEESTRQRLAAHVEKLDEVERRIEGRMVWLLSSLGLQGDDPEKVEALRQALIAELHQMPKINAVNPTDEKDLSANS